MTDARPKTLIACVGNSLLLDEGFGPYMAKVLTQREVALRHVDEEHADILMDMFKPEEENMADDGRIPVMDGGTMGMSLVGRIRDYDRIIVLDIIDCKNPDIPPGSVFTLTPEEMAESAVLHSLHDLKVADVVANAAFAGYEAEVVCICVQPKDYDPPDFVADTLSDELYEAIPMVLGALMEAIEA